MTFSKAFTNATIFSALSTAMTLTAIHLTGDDYDVTDDYTEVNTYDKIVSTYRKNGRQLVWGGASSNTIYDTPEDNISFRAVHDWIHINMMLRFNPEDEAKVLRIQQGLISNTIKNNLPAFSQYLGFDQSAKDLIKCVLFVMEADLMGIVKYQEKWGFYPKNQAAFVQDFLDDPIAALNTRYEQWQA